MESTNDETPMQSDDFSIKSVHDLSPVDITLHPIYRNDGMMLVNRYTTLGPYLLSQIKRHLNGAFSMPIIVASSEKQLNSFLDHHTYSNAEFLMLLDKVIHQSIQNYKVPLSLDAYVDERVDLSSMFNLKADKPPALKKIAKAAEPKEDTKERSVNPNINKYSILAKMTSSTTLWSSLDKSLKNEHLQNRAVSMKKKLLSILNEDVILIELANKMSSYDDLLLKHAMNIACISILFGLTNRLSDEDLLNLIITALFCNIGFIDIEKNIFYNYLKGDSHVVVMNQHIKNSLGIISPSSFCRNKSIIFGILDHHEYFNGSGTPTGKRGKDINIFGRIITIALEYDRLNNSYFGEETVSPYVTENILKENNQKRFDPEIISNFINYNR